MKHFGIILSILVLLCFAAACMQPEKEVFESAEMQAQKLTNGNDPAASGNTIYSKSACSAPTNLTVAVTPIGQYEFSWTPPANPPMSYTFMITGNNVAITTNVSTPTCTVTLPTSTTPYTVSIASNCSGNSSTPLVSSFSTMGGGTSGGTVLTVVDDLDGLMFRPPYTTGYNQTFLNKTVLNLVAKNLVYEGVYFAPQNFQASKMTTLPSGDYFNMFRFMALPATDFVQTSSCTNNSNLLDVMINESIPAGNTVAYKENIAGAKWCTFVVSSGSLMGSNLSVLSKNVKIPGLKRGAYYDIKIFNTISYTAPSISAQWYSCM